MTLPRLYTDLVALFPVLTPPAEYATEAAFWRDALRERLGSGRHRVLELGVGGGHNLSHLTADFDAVAVDLAHGMVEHCRRLNPTVPCHVGDMRTVRLDETFDAVLIHDAISYLLTEDDLRATFATVVAHLRPGGVFLTSPDHVRETFSERVSGPHHRLGVDLDLTSMDYEFDLDPHDTRTESVMVYVIRDGADVPRVEVDRHEFGLFPLATWTRLLDEAGFDVEVLDYPVHDDGRPGYLFAGTRRS